MDMMARGRLAKIARSRDGITRLLRDAAFSSSKID